MRPSAQPQDARPLPAFHQPPFHASAQLGILSTIEVTEQDLQESLVNARGPHSISMPQLVGGVAAPLEMALEVSSLPRQQVHDSNDSAMTGEAISHVENRIAELQSQASMFV